MTFTEYFEAFAKLMEENGRIVSAVRDMTRAGTADDRNPAFVLAQKRHRQLADDIVNLNQRYFGDGPGR